VSTPTPIHWARGGSNSDRIVACPGCVQEASRWPEDPGSKYAIDGTHSHTLLEHCLRASQWDATFYEGHVLQDHEGAFTVDLERAKRVNVALRYINDRMRALHRSGRDVALHVEEFVDAGAAHNIPEWGGSADVILRWDSGIEVIDYKDGGKPVNAETYQMITYAIGARHKHEVPPAASTITTIIQPKVSQDAKSMLYEPLEFHVKELILAKAMRRSMEDDAPRDAGEHCKWCPGAKPGRCEEFNRRAHKAMSDIVASIPAQPGTNNPLQIPEISAETTNEQLAQLLDAKPIVLGLLNEAEAEALKRARSGQDVPGYELDRKVSRRKWDDGALDTLDKMRVKEHVYTERKLRTPKQVIDSDEFKGLSENQQKKIQALIVKPEGAVCLVPKGTSKNPVLTDTKSVVDAIPKPDPAPAASPEPLSFL